MKAYKANHKEEDKRKGHPCGGRLHVIFHPEKYIQNPNLVGATNRFAGDSEKKTLEKVVWNESWNVEKLKEAKKKETADGQYNKRADNQAEIEHAIRMMYDHSFDDRKSGSVYSVRSKYSKGDKEKAVVCPLCGSELSSKKQAA